MTILLAVGTVVLGGASAWARIRGATAAAGILKMVAASGYLAVAWMSGAPTTPYGSLVFTALVLSWVGDLLLIPGGRGPLFLGGLVSFLTAHVAYGVAFMVRGISAPWALAVAVLLAAALWMILSRLLRHDTSRRMRGPVVAYGVVIGAMVAGAVGTAGHSPSLLIPLGAVLFLASDLFVARQRFVEAEALNTAVGLPLYFLAQVLLALSV
ncbi:MAG: lysoplasmalogenase [Gemmatimonadota bacterium]